MDIIARKDAQAQGLKRYFTGKPCKHGHLSERLTSNSDCLDCSENRLAAWKQAYPEKTIEYKAKYYVENRDRTRIMNTAWRAANPEIVKSRRKAWLQANRHRKNQSDIRRKKERRNTDFAFVIVGRLRARLGGWLRYQGASKSAPTMELVGCTREELVAHIEAQFQPGMSWENRSEWHLDHIRPCASFDLLDPAQQRECFHYTNLQPLWAFDNMSKGARWEPAIVAT